MLTRKALIIGSPDEKIPGVKVDIENLKIYLKSPIGGYWRDNEITTLISPSKDVVSMQIDLLRTSDYSLIFFAGHGYHSVEKNRTIVHINSAEKLDTLELRKGAQKHTLILDCCRKPVVEQRLHKLAIESESANFLQRQKLDAAQCRQYFEKRISECENGIVVMNACKIDETAGETESTGGYYTSSLIDSANEWARKQLASLDLSKNYSIFSTQECHNMAVEQVKLLSGNRQNPSFESPRTEKKFPFTVVA